MGEESKRPELLAFFACAAPISFRRLLLALMVCASPAVVEGTEVFDLFVTVCEIDLPSPPQSSILPTLLYYPLGRWFPLPS